MLKKGGNTHSMHIQHIYIQIIGLQIHARKNLWSEMKKKLTVSLLYFSCCFVTFMKQLLHRFLLISIRSFQFYNSLSSIIYTTYCFKSWNIWNLFYKKCPFFDILSQGFNCCWSNRQSYFIILSFSGFFHSIVLFSIFFTQ